MLALALILACATTDAPTDTESAFPLSAEALEYWEGFDVHGGATELDASGVFPLLLCCEMGAWCAPPTAWRIGTQALTVECPADADRVWVRWVM